MTAKNDLLLEIGCEEIPSRFIADAMKQLEKYTDKMLLDRRIGFGEIKTWGTPRRLVLLVNDLEQQQPDLIDKIKGPSVQQAYDQSGKPTRALEGFIRSHRVSLEMLEEEAIGKARYIVVEKNIPGQPTEKLLAEILPEIIGKLVFPKPMYWQSKDNYFARPIRWLLALYGSHSVEFNYAGIRAGQKTFGHRFIAPGPYEVSSIEQYFQCLEEGQVVLDQEKRRKLILKQLEQIASEKDGKALVNQNLLEEVTYLVEYPVAIYGEFDKEFLDLPSEVPITTMQNHQRYFPVISQKSGNLMPCFIGISNNRFHPNIRKGYEKVLQARLADGRFFFEEDRKKPLENYVDQLKNVIYLESLGSLDQKRDRLVRLTGRLGAVLNWPADLVKRAQRVAHLCKADLVTGMVKEFPGLQGIMGREYALSSGESEPVALGIFEHYLPRHATDQLPQGKEGALVSLTDRIDTLAGCFSAGIQPTGSQDPYALRRQAQGAVLILINQEFALPLLSYIDSGIDILAENGGIGNEQLLQLKNSIYEFIVQRIRYVMRDRGIGHDVIEAVLKVPFDTISGLFSTANILNSSQQTPLLDDVVVAYNRVTNLASAAEKGAVDKSLFINQEEGALFEVLLATESAINRLDDPGAILKELQALKQPIDSFFDNVMVMVDDQTVRSNRLKLLNALKVLFNRLADFSQIPVM